MYEPEADSDHAYFRAIEDLFIQLRGSPLLLSPADWQVARRWHRQGIPLELVRRTLEDLFAARRRRKARGQVRSLRYCARAVEGAWEEVQELTAVAKRGEAGGYDIPARLRALAAALPAGLPGREAWTARLVALEGDLQTVEQRLADLDRELLEAAAGGLGDPARERVEAEVASTLAGLASRLPAAELERAREQLRRRAVRRERELPVLSLFSPEAEPGEG